MLPSVFVSRWLSTLDLPLRTPNPFPQHWSMYKLFQWRWHQNLHRVRWTRPRPTRQVKQWLPLFWATQLLAFHSSYTPSSTNFASDGALSSQATQCSECPYSSVIHFRFCASLPKVIRNCFIETRTAGSCLIYHSSLVLL